MPHTAREPPKGKFPGCLPLRPKVSTEPTVLVPMRLCFDSCMPWRPPGFIGGYVCTFPSNCIRFPPGQSIGLVDVDAEASVDLLSPSGSFRSNVGSAATLFVVRWWLNDRPVVIQTTTHAQRERERKQLHLCYAHSSHPISFPILTCSSTHSSLLVLSHCRPIHEFPASLARMPS